MLAFTGLETVANLAAEARRPGVDLPRSVFGGIATVVTMYVAIAVVALSAFPGPSTELGGRWIRAPLLGVAHSIGDELPWGLGGVLEFYVGITGALILLVAVTTSISGFRAARVLARRARPTPAQLRAAEPASARFPAGDHCCGAHLVRDRDRHLVPPPRCRVPREPVLVRRPDRIHRRPARGDQAAHQRARPGASVSRAVQHAHQGRRHPGAGGRRCDRDRHDLRDRARDASRRPLRRAGLARDRPRRLHRRAHSPRRRPDGEGAGARRATGRGHAFSSCRFSSR